jgi:hypothetical protein
MKAFIATIAFRLGNAMLQPAFRESPSRPMGPLAAKDLCVLQDCSPDLTPEHASTKIPFGLMLVLVLLILFALFKIAAS